MINIEEHPDGHFVLGFNPYTPSPLYRAYSISSLDLSHTRVLSHFIYIFLSPCLFYFLSLSLTSLQSLDLSHTRVVLSCSECLALIFSLYFSLSFSMSLLIYLSFSHSLVFSFYSISSLDLSHTSVVCGPYLVQSAQH